MLPRAPLAVNGNGGSDTFNVSSDAPNHLGNLNGIQAKVTITASGAKNRLFVSDYSGTTSKTVTVTDHSIVGLAPADIEYSVVGGGDFTNSAGIADGIKLQGSNTAATTFNIQSTLQGSSTWVAAGGKSDVFNVGNAGSLGLIKGTLTVDGMGHDATPTTTLSVTSSDGNATATNTLPVGDTVNFNDQADNTSGGFTYTLTGTSLDRSDLPQGTPSIAYSNAETINLNTALQASTINVTSTAANANTTVTGSINGVPTKGVFNIAGTGASSNSKFIAAGGDTTFNLQSTGVGSFTQIQGQGGNDRLLVSSNAIAGTRGNIDGINGALAIDAGAGDNNRLIIDNFTGAANTNFVFHRDYLTGLGVESPTIVYAATGGHFLNSDASMLDGIQVSTSDLGGNTIGVRGTLGGSSTQILGGSNRDIITVSNASRSLADVQGVLSIDARGGTNQLFYDNRGSTVGAHAVVNDNKIVGFAPADLYYQATGGNFDSLANIPFKGSGVLLQGSQTARDAFLAQSTLAGSTTAIEGGGGDVYYVAHCPRFQSLAGPIRSRCRESSPTTEIWMRSAAGCISSVRRHQLSLHSM